MNRKRREQLILDAAVRVIARQGYEQTSVSEIIDEARVARGTFYLYFKSKKNIFSALLDRFLTDLSRNIAKIKAADGPAEFDLAQRIRLQASDLISTITQNKLLAKILLIDAHSIDRECHAKLNQFIDEIAAVIRHDIDENIKIGIFRNANSEVAARCLIGSIKEAISNWVIDGSYELEPVIEGLIDTLLYGVAPFPASLEKELANAEAKVATRFNDLH